MGELFVIFEREGIDGSAVVGSSVSDVGRRFGVNYLEHCDVPNDVHDCTVSINNGEASLSPISQLEIELLGGNERKAGERLACYAQITGRGDISIMTQEKEPVKTDEAKDKFVDEFAALPLEQKLASLLRMEAVTLGETFDFVISSPMKVFSKVGDVMAEFGIKLDEAAKEASKPKNRETRTSKKAKTEKPRSRRVTKQKPDASNS